MIKRIGITVIFSFSVLLTLYMATPRVYYSKFPPGIGIGTLQDPINKLRKLRSVDTLILSLDSLGGSVAELERFFKARQATEGTLVCTIDHIAASAAAMAEQTCDKVIIAKHARVLFHMPRISSSEKNGDTQIITIKIITKNSTDPRYAAYYKYFVKVMKHYKVDQVLTEREWDYCLRGADIIVTGEELAKRGSKRVMVKK